MHDTPVADFGVVAILGSLNITDRLVRRRERMVIIENNGRFHLTCRQG
jgi:hypothetical protein